MPHLPLFVFLSLLGCGSPDADGDGFTAALDCDDGDAAVNPGAAEVCDGVDNNCSGDVDEAPADTDANAAAYPDEDGDGFGIGLTSTVCTGPGTADNNDDCNDENATVFPDANELCDGLDNDCDGNIDNGTHTETFYEDRDGDGYGDPASSVEGCTPPAGYVRNSDDCSDENANLSPETRWYPDRDADGHGWPYDFVTSCSYPPGDGPSYVRSSTDCLDTDRDVYLGAVAEDITACMKDEDGDGFGSASPPEGVDAGTDCLDTDATIFPGNTAEDPTACMQDADSDGFGSTDPPDGVDVGTDCDDENDRAYPGRPERCSGFDNDCNGIIDDDYAVDASTWYADSDGDDFGDISATTPACEQPAGYTDNALDCDDGNDAVSPDAWESCTDGVDNDCDGDTDEICTLATTDVDVTLTGSQRDDALGYRALHTSGDLTGDGNPDLTVGAYRAGSSGEGEVYVVAGPLTSSHTQSANGAASATVTGEDSSDYFGINLDIGDVDGDGYDDLVATASQAERNYIVNPGGVFVFYGPLSGAISAADADLSFWGEARLDYYGLHVVAAYDYDGDGAAEVIASAEEASLTHSDQGVIGIHSGGEDDDTASNAETSILGEYHNHHVGRALDTPGDLSGDGLNDLLYSSHPNDTVYALYGNTTGLRSASDADITITGPSGSDAGSAIISGDLNGDGHADLVIGAPADSSNTGSLYILSGPLSSSHTLSTDASAMITGDDAGENLGVFDSALALGDVDNDGAADLLLGSSDNDSGSSSGGGTFLFYGSLSGTLALSDTDILLYGDSGEDQGTAVSLGDLSGDGTLDIITTGYGAEDTRGQVYVLFNGSLP